MDDRRKYYGHVWFSNLWRSDPRPQKKDGSANGKAESGSAKKARGISTKGIRNTTSKRRLLNSGMNLKPETFDIGFFVMREYCE